MRLNVTGMPVPMVSEHTRTRATKASRVVTRGAAAVSTVWTTVTPKSRRSFTVRSVLHARRSIRRPVATATVRASRASAAIAAETCSPGSRTRRSPRSIKPSWTNVRL
jgi:hypothetical protein